MVAFKKEGERECFYLIFAHAHMGETKDYQKYKYFLHVFDLTWVLKLSR